MYVIKRAIISAIKYTCVLFSKVYSYRSHKYALSLAIRVYSLWVSTEFKDVGDKTVIKGVRFLIGGRNINIGSNCVIGYRAVLTAWDRHGIDTFDPVIVIGNNVAIGDESHISAINSIIIEDNVLMGKKVTISDNAHGQTSSEDLLLPPALRRLHSNGPVVIEEGVWIGDKVTVLPNVRIGKNSIIGANAVVTRDVPNNCIAVGVPAKVVRKIV